MTMVPAAVHRRTSHPPIIPFLLPPSSSSPKFHRQEPISSFSIPLPTFLCLTIFLPDLISHISSLKIFFSFSAPLSTPLLLLSLEDKALAPLLASLPSDLLRPPNLPSYGSLITAALLDDPPQVPPKFLLKVMMHGSLKLVRGEILPGHTDDAGEPQIWWSNSACVGSF